VSKGGLTTKDTESTECRIHFNYQPTA
jgi:hypothetical protein